MDKSKNFFDYSERIGKKKLRTLLVMVGVGLIVAIILIVIPLEGGLKALIGLASFFLIFGGGLLFAFPRTKSNLVPQLQSFTPWIEASYKELEEEKVLLNESAILNIYIGAYRSDDAYHKGVRRRVTTNIVQVMTHINALLLSMSPDKQKRTRNLSKQIDQLKDALIVNLIPGKMKKRLLGSEGNSLCLSRKLDIKEQLERLVKIGGFLEERTYNTLGMASYNNVFLLDLNTMTVIFKNKRFGKRITLSPIETAIEITENELTWILRSLTLLSNPNLKIISKQLHDLFSEKSYKSVQQVQDSFNKWLILAEDTVHTCKKFSLWDV